MRKLRTLVPAASLAALACALVPSAASAAPTLMDPAASATVAASGKTTFTYTLPAGEHAATVYVSAANNADATTGAFPADASRVEAATIPDGTTTFTPTMPLFAGSWFWTVTDLDGAGAAQHAEVRPFTVPVLATPKAVTHSLTEKGRTLKGQLIYVTNLQAPKLRLQLFYGKKRVYNEASVVKLGRDDLGFALQTSWVWRLPKNQAFNKGIKLRAVFSVTGNGTTKSFQKAFKV